MYYAAALLILRVSVITKPRTLARFWRLTAVQENRAYDLSWPKTPLVACLFCLVSVCTVPGTCFLPQMEKVCSYLFLACTQSNNKKTERTTNVYIFPVYTGPIIRCSFFVFFSIFLKFMSMYYVSIYRLLTSFFFLFFPITKYLFWIVGRHVSCLS